MNQPIERESMEVDVLFIGAGPASLASALHLMNHVEARNSERQARGEAPLEPPTVLVLEKGAAVGDHLLSGGVMNPRAMRELMPDFEEQGFPTEHVCTDAITMLFTEKRSFTFPVNPPNFEKKGYHVVSLSSVGKWLESKCEEAGIEIYPGFPGREILYSEDGQTVIGVRTGDMGLDKEGNPKATFQPGMDILAKVVVLGEGVRGSLTKQLIEDHGLKGMNPQTYETGIKEIWRINPDKHKPGRVLHGMGWPNYFHPLGGMFLYDMKDNLVSFGYVTALDTENPNVDPHLAAQKFKTTPFMRDLLEGAELVRYGAKTIPTGGLYAQPKLYTNGAMIVGDAAGMCNAERLTGIHMAIKTGMQAAETIVDAMEADDFSAATLGNYSERFQNSWAYEEHHRSRNFHGSWEKGAAFFFLNEPFRQITGGRGLIDPIRTHPGHEMMRPLSWLPEEKRKVEEFKFDNKLTFTKDNLVGFSGTAHEEDQPCHLQVADTNICATQCLEEYGNPCVKFCPAAVYEMVEDAAAPNNQKLFIHHENCVHCKTCDIADPYQIITWVTPEGGEGPDYTQM